MFGRTTTLFRLFGFHVQADMSWLFLALLITWSLATGYFPFEYEHLPASFYWGMALVGAAGLFASLIFHELAHSLVARRFGIPIKGITLFIFGGVAHMDEEPPGPRSEFWMAVAGPLSSLLLAAGFYAVMQGGRAIGWPEPLAGITGYLAFINVLLAVFNLVPAFPLDGGRVFRSALWAWTGNLQWATRVASRFGSGFGIVLMVLGALSVFTGRFVGGFWYVLIGFFLYNAAGQAYAHLLVRGALKGEPVRRFMSRDPVTVSPDLPVQSLVDDYLYRYLYDMFPVLRGSTVVGCVTTKDVGALPRAEWARKTVADVMRTCSPENTVQAGTDAMAALARMNRTGSSRLMVLDGDKLVGILVLKDLMKLVAFRMDLEQMEEAA
ncbi:site-2 protease family protein [Nitrospira moscoviensis]|uniref:Zinc metalloprotease n=1 Tax=Nitrospira moscoviensis TaxID=42253 RepID=A0A0K2GEU8_NITMO|nr:site-2 protease family protein [Nitrospira moscoviensis]ALA59137.1 Putative zinc metalloprotease containing CBS domain pair [Nitrospira moscoviensis]